VSFKLQWTPRAAEDFNRLKAAAERSRAGGNGRRTRTKASKQEGLFKQVTKALGYLAENPRHKSLQTHKFESLPHPYQRDGDVFEAYAQNKTPGAYRIFWCYGPAKGQITIIAITPHP
jgi:hypothetical protein